MSMRRSKITRLGLTKHGSTTIIYWWTMFIVLFGVLTVQAQNDLGENEEARIQCPDGFFNVNCTGVCHCLNGHDQCQQTDGLCKDYQCERGWMNSPYCDQECPDGYFGSECLKECHCQPGVLCLKWNGACVNNVCHEEWFGSACQTRLPKLIDPPLVVNATCTQLVLSWWTWLADRDIGSGQIASYTVQMSSDSGQWLTLNTVYPSTADVTTMNMAVQNLNNVTFYEFRIISNLEDFGKIVVGLPGPPSAKHKPNCTETTTTTTTTRSLLTTTENVTNGFTTTTTEPVLTTTTTTTTDQAPSIVRNVRLTRNISSHVTIEWERPTYVGTQFVGYNFTYQTVGIGDCSGSEIENTVYVPLQPHRTSYTFLLANLQPWCRIIMEIRAENLQGHGDYVRREFTTPEKEPSGAVQNIRHTLVGTTEVTFQWDAVSCSLRGGPLKYYDVLVRDIATTSRVMQQHSSQLSMHVDNLASYRRYGVRVRYVNSKGAGPYSDEYVLTTKQYVPSAPRNVMVTLATSSTLQVSWLPPDPANGVLLEYRVVYWAERNTEVKHSLRMEVNGRTIKVITGLLPFTAYYVQVAARTGAEFDSGWGNASDPVRHMTADGKPGMPGSFNRTNRTESCITVSWTAPQLTNGVINSYRVIYKQMSVVSKEQSRDIPADQLSFTACGLQSGALYRFGVSAKTRTSYGPTNTLNLWTELDTPTKPATPKVIAHNDTTITVAIKPVDQHRVPISGYFIVVSPMITGRRKKRSLPDPVKSIAGLLGYTTAQLTNEILMNGIFTIGDDQFYGSYRNRPLERNADYLLSLVVASSLDGIVKMALSQVVGTTKRKSVITVNPETSTTSTTQDVTTAQALTAEDDDSTSRILAIVIPLLLIIIIAVVIALIVWWYMSRKAKKLQAEEKRSAWLNYYTSNFSDTALCTNKGKWTDIYELNAARIPIYTETYKPVDLKVSEIYHSKPQISFDEEYRQLPHSSQCTSRAAEDRQNQRKNRFDHLLAYDHSRVVLADVEPGNTDYVNANYIHGYESRNTYIAVQSPFNDITICDFWRVVYQEKVSQIVFMGRLQEDGVVKSERYWPELRSEQYGDVLVSFVGTSTFASFIVRQFDILTDGKAIRRVTQYQFLGWPDHGVPDDPIPLLEFHAQVRRGTTADDSVPMLVHCGTGVSRSAVFIAVDALLQQARVENAVNVFNFCNKMRRNRVMMVRTLKQYIFIYDLLFEALITTYNLMSTDLKMNYRQLSRVNAVSNVSYFREQFDVLETFVEPLADSKCVHALRDANLEKNRFPSILALDAYRPILKTTDGLGRTDYINALYIDGYRKKNQFIVTQTPLQSTVVDFWKLVYDYNVTTIVTLNGSDFVEDTCAEYWPPGQAVQQWQPFYVKPESTDAAEHETVRTAQLRNAQQPSEPARVVRQFRFEAWRMYEKVPWARGAFLDFIERVAHTQADSVHPHAPIIVHCMDGASQSGLFCACAVVCEKMQVDHQVDVFHTIKHMKRRRPHFVNSLEQYKFCFKLLWDFLNTRMNITPTDNDESTVQW